MTDNALQLADDQQPFHIGDRMRKARESAGFDRQRFAATVGIHRDTIMRNEEGRTKPKRSTLIAVAWATGVRLEWLESGQLPWRDRNPRPSDYKSAVSGRLPRIGLLTAAGPREVVRVDFQRRKAAVA